MWKAYNGMMKIGIEERNEKRYCKKEMLCILTIQNGMNKPSKNRRHFINKMSQQATAQRNPKY